MRLGTGDLLLVLVIGLVGPSIGFGVLSDPGLGWHLRVPDVVFADGFTTTDPFSDPPGRYWLANQWFGELPFWAGWKLAGWNGVAAVALGLLLLTYRLLFGWLRADGVAWPLALGLTVLACAAGYVGWLARPTMFTTLFTAVVARAVVLFHEDRFSTRQLLWLVPLFAVWVNCHGGFVAGLATIGLAAGVEGCLGVLWRDRVAIRRCGILAAVGLAATLATLVNPYGWRVYPWVFSLLGDPYFMNLNGEWKSPDFHDPAAARFEWLVLLTVALLAVSRYRPSLLVLVIVLFWLHQSFQGRRFTPIGVLVLATLTGRLAAAVLARRASTTTACASYQSTSSGADATAGGLDLPLFMTRWFEEWRPFWSSDRDGGWLGGVLAGIGLASWALITPSLTPDAPAVPEPALRALLDRWRPGEVVFHSPNHGGYLTLHGWHSLGLRTTIDDRNEVQGRSRYEDYFAVIETQTGWQERLDQNRVDWVVAERGTPLADRLAEQPERWRAEYRDAEATLFRRR